VSLAAQGALTAPVILVYLILQARSVVVPEGLILTAAEAVPALTNPTMEALV
jgi:hypothetical protein